MTLYDITAHVDEFQWLDLPCDLPRISFTLACSAYEIVRVHNGNLLEIGYKLALTCINLSREDRDVFDSL